MDKKRLDIMCDLETLGRDSDTAVFQIAAIAFNIESGEFVDKFNGLADISSSKILVDGDTLKWWLNTNKELLTELINNGSGTEKDLFVNFHAWLKALTEEYEVYFWGNGILFDNRLVKEKLNIYGLDYPVFYRNDRDVRTILELAAMKTGITEKEFHERCKLPDLVTHNAYDDVLYQINLVRTCWKTILKTEE